MLYTILILLTITSSGSSSIVLYYTLVSNTFVRSFPLVRRLLAINRSIRTVRETKSIIRDITTTIATSIRIVSWM